MTLWHRSLFLIALSLCASLAHAAGFAFIEVPAGKDGPALLGAVWTPCDAPAVKIAIDPLVIEGTRNCPISGTQLPLVVVSHGKGGSSLLHHDTAAALADAGFVVAAINHPGHNYQDMSGASHLSVYATRPADMKRLVDYMLSAWPGRAALDANRVGLFGFSAGGYTGLVSVGAVPDFRLREDLCPPASTVPLCGEIRRNEVPKMPPPDNRIKAAVIVDPLTAFDAGGLKGVTLPMQLWASAFGGDGVAPRYVEELRRDLPVKPEWHMVQGATHFAFVAPCPPSMAQAMPEICRDRLDFDRAAFHAHFNAQVLAFFRQHLGPHHAYRQGT
ncbi:alpha/beta hydrolase family protein [Variovorax sp. ZT5P49]|uniref:alpha/beta hydrolase family protein n=1 Tax=Variovorax sp. ZT5P49 TaxID=3443733 RepID=UPI003F48FE41